MTVNYSKEDAHYPSGMKRGSDEGKPRYDLVDRVMLKRWAVHMAEGAKRYGEENWRNANSEEELNRYRASAYRHLIQWLEGETDEDHAAAIFFNIAAAEYVKGQRGVGLPTETPEEFSMEDMHPDAVEARRWLKNNDPNTTDPL